jgi:rare lipoprotein A
MQARTAILITGLLASGLANHTAEASAAQSAVIPSVLVSRATPAAFSIPITPPARHAASAAASSAASAETVLDSGEASWYGPRHAGHRTSSGERFDPQQMTAAHPSLPLGTMVRVTDLATGRSVIVRVNDREPPHGVRCIDLSEGAARVLGIHGSGVAEVTLTSVHPEEAPVEVAEAPDDATAVDAAPASSVRQATSRHGRQHRHHAGR